MQRQRVHRLRAVVGGLAPDRLDREFERRGLARRKPEPPAQPVLPEVVGEHEPRRGRCREPVSEQPNLTWSARRSNSPRAPFATTPSRVSRPSSASIPPESGARRRRGGCDRHTRRRRRRRPSGRGGSCRVARRGGPRGARRAPWRAAGRAARRGATRRRGPAPRIGRGRAGADRDRPCAPHATRPDEPLPVHGGSAPGPVPSTTTIGVSSSAVIISESSKWIERKHELR